MTQFLPILSSVVGRMTSGERRFARRLESHLEDDYVCWYNVPVGAWNQHPDFLILHSRRDPHDGACCGAGGSQNGNFVLR